MPPLVEGLLIGSSGGVLYWLVDRYEPNRSIAYLPKFLVVLWGSAAVLHRTQSFGYGWF
jgi:hypothetical protein